MRRFAALALIVAASSCSSAAAQCSAWAGAACPADFPNISQPVTEEACVSNFEFACGFQDCDVEHDAKIACETEHPTCCNDVECDDGDGACSEQRTAWEDCVTRLRAECEEAAS